MYKPAFMLLATVLAVMQSGAAAAQAAIPRVAEVDWSSAGTISVSTGFKDRLKDVDNTLLPVLIPRPFFDYKSLTFVGQELEYAASVRADPPMSGRAGRAAAKSNKDVVLSVVGTRIAVDDGSGAGNEDTTVGIQLEDKSAMATFKKYGVAYVVTVECGLATDRRCADERYVRDLVASLELVGGGRGAPATKPIAPPAPSGLIGVAADPNFDPNPPGKLISGTGVGVTNSAIYAPNIRFPIAEKPAYLNSQVYGYGGHLGPRSGKGWRDSRNYAYQWSDNFCEKRSRKTPACPSGTGHQGVDIRPADPADAKHTVVAVEDGRIVKIGVYSVTLAAQSGTHYNYLHMEMPKLKVRLGSKVNAGQPIGVVSNDFGGVPTSIHLHFEIMQNSNGRGWRHVPPYSSLVAAYKAM